MLYNSGDQFNLIYYNGKPISTIYKDGECIYPGTPQHIAIMVGFLSLTDDITSTITAILRSPTAPLPQYSAIDVSGSVSGYDRYSQFISISSSCPIYMWRSGTVIYWYSLAKTVKIVGLGYRTSTPYPLVSKSFANYYNLSDISGLQDWDIHWVGDTFYSLNDRNYVNSLYRLFTSCTSLSDISALAAWNTHNITNAWLAFGECVSISSLAPISNWDLSSMQDLVRTFYSCRNLTSINNVNWDISNSLDVNGIFADCCSVYSVSNVQLKLPNTFNAVFANLSNTNYELYSVDLSLCTAPKGLISDPTGTFRNCSNLTICDLGDVFSSIRNDSSTAANGMFYGCRSLQTLIIRNLDIVVERTSSDGLIDLANNSGTIYVPQSQINNYLADSEWSSLVSAGAHILPLEGSIYEQPGSVSELYS